MDMTPFTPLVGTWDLEATHPEFDGVVTGHATFSMLPGGTFLVRRSVMDHPLFPDSISVLGSPEDDENACVAEYFDERGVRRTYAVSLRDGVLREWREHPTFAQRSQAPLTPDRFVQQWQLARDGGPWADDLRAEFRRRR